MLVDLHTGRLAATAFRKQSLDESDDAIVSY